MPHEGQIIFHESLESFCNSAINLSALIFTKIEINYITLTAFLIK